MEALEIFSTCPQSKDVPRELYRSRVVDVARWSEEFGYRGILVYTDNSIISPWAVSQIIIENTKSLCPLVAVQPVYAHPYFVAKEVTTLAFLYRRKVYLNMVAGGFKTDLEALDDRTPHDRRYERLTEYTVAIKRLLADAAPVSIEGEFYTVKNLKLAPLVPRELLPGIFVSGSSEAGMDAARTIGALAVKYPKPPDEDEGASSDEGVSCGIRVGVIAREDEASAWEIALDRFPEDRRGQLTHQLAMKVSDSVWHGQLSSLGSSSDRPTYWLGPFENYKTFCPYLVGSYGKVAGELARYIGLGYRTFILDIPPDRDDLRHTNIAFEEALRQTGSGP